MQKKKSKRESNRKRKEMLKENTNVKEKTPKPWSIKLG